MLIGVCNPMSGLVCARTRSWTTAELPTPRVLTATSTAFWTIFFNVPAILSERIERRTPGTTPRACGWRFSKRHRRDGKEILPDSHVPCTLQFMLLKAKQRSCIFRDFDWCGFALAAPPRTAAGTPLVIFWSPSPRRGPLCFKTRWCVLQCYTDPTSPDPPKIPPKI